MQKKLIPYHISIIDLFIFVKLIRGVSTGNLKSI